MVDVSAKSLATINDVWEGVTFVYLRADDAKSVRFKITTLPGKGKLFDSPDRHSWCQVPSLYTTAPTYLLRHALRYVPDRNQVGQDTFKFRAVDAQGRESTDAVATIEIERGGLRWEFTTNANTGFSGAATASEENPKTIGASASDYMFRLDWQWRTPRSQATLESSDIRVNPDARLHWWPRSFHVALLSGFQQRPLATTVEPSPGVTPARTLAYHRAFTVGADVHLGWVTDLDAQGTYAEVGPVAGAYFDAFIGEKSVIKNGVPMKLLPMENANGYSRFEAGLRLAFKKLDTDTPIGIARRTERAKRRSEEEVWLQPGNPGNLFVLDLLVQRQDALSGLVPHRDTRHRWAFRFMTMPSVPGGGDATFLLGIEVSRDLAKQGPKDVRVFYGLGFSP